MSAGRGRALAGGWHWRVASAVGHGVWGFNTPAVALGGCSLIVVEDAAEAIARLDSAGERARRRVGGWSARLRWGRSALQWQR